MPEPLEPALNRVRDLLLDPERLVRAVAAGRRRRERPAWRRTELRYVDVKAGRQLQITRYDATQAHTTNVPVAEAEGPVAEILAEPYGNWHVDTTESDGVRSLQLRVTKKGAAQVHEGESTPKRGESGQERSHDRKKQRVLDPSDPFWHAVGISDAEGRVKPSRQGKFRQVEEFLKQLGPALDDALRAGRLRQPSAEEPLRVLDLGCGNAYLTFAAYRYLTGVRGLPARMTGVDVKDAARARNTALAAELGWQDMLTFVAGRIDDDLDRLLPEDSARPDVVLALHACDTATDDALAQAVRRRVPLVLAAPCCHHDVQRQLRDREPPVPYALLCRHGILREKLADVLTDTLRAAVLRLMGYRVDVVEFVDSTHTPRNLLLRAVHTGARPTTAVDAEYEQLTNEWGLHPALAVALNAELAEVRAR